HALAAAVTSRRRSPSPPGLVSYRDRRLGMKPRQDHARQQFARLAAAPDHALDLAEAALWLGAEEDGPVDVEAYLARLDQLAAALRPQLTADLGPRARLDLLLAYVFRELGFHGDES